MPIARLVISLILCKGVERAIAMRFEGEMCSLSIGISCLERVVSFLGKLCEKRRESFPEKKSFRNTKLLQPFSKPRGTECSVILFGKPIEQSTSEAGQVTGFLGG